MRSLFVAVCLVAVGLALAPGMPAGALAPHADPALAFGRLPLAFTANDGQVDPEVRFVARSPLGTAFLTSKGAVFALKSDKPSSAFRMRLQGARPHSAVTAEAPLPGKVNELLGDDPSKWRTGLSTFGQVRYRAVYPGVDLVFHGSPQRMEYDFEVAAGADPSAIRLAFEGADHLRIDRDGDLILSLGGKDVRYARPVVYQQVGSERRNVDGAYVLHGQEVAFALGGYDAQRPLVIDPVLQYSTYLGGTGADGVYGVAVDASGATYLTGDTTSATFPVNGAFQATNAGGADAFVVKLSSTGALVYATYLGGSLDDGARAIAIDGSGSAYVTGITNSTNFPTLNASQPANAGYHDAFVTKLSPSGASLSYSTYLGGAANDDDGSGIQVDASGNAYVSGNTYSYNFPFTTGAAQPGIAGGSDAFVAKFNATGARVYSTFLGGSGYDSCTGIAIDGAGNMYIVGSTPTSSTNFPTTSGAAQTTPGGPNFTYDAYFARINANGSLGYSTFLGGSSSEQANAVAVDSAGNAYVTGYTSSTNFPTLNPLQPAKAGGQDVFVTKFAANGSLAWSTYLGGTGDEQGKGIALDSAGNVYLTGGTASGDFPTLHPLQGTKAATYDAFVTKLGPGGGTLVYSTFLGGGGDDEGYALALDSAKNVYVGGQTGSSDFPTANPAQAANNGSYDAFVAKLDLAAPALQAVTPNFGSTAGGTSVTLTGSQFAPGITLTWGGASVPVTYVNSTTLTATAPAHAAGSVNVVVTNTDGRTGPLNAGFLYVTPPQVTGVSPSSGPASGGTMVTITGSAFASGATVSIGGTPATNVTWVSATTLTAITPAHAPGLVDVTVSNPPGVTGTKSNAFTFNPPPSITLVSPSVGPSPGGTMIDLTGANFVTGAVVRLDGVAATNVTVVSSTHITAIAPAHAVGVVDVEVQNPDGQSFTLSGGFTYEPPLKVTSVDPYYGPIAGGTSLNVTGDNFKPGIQVTLGGVAIAAANVSDPKHLTITSPPHAAGKVDIVVTNPNGETSTAQDAFQYLVPPTVTGVTPAVGTTAGGTAVNVTGSDFIVGTRILFGGIVAPQVLVLDSAHITATTPSHGAGSVDVVATGPQTAFNVPPSVVGPPLVAGFSYLEAPTLTSVDPASGSGAGGTAVTLTGTNFFAGATVYFGSAAATNVNVVSDTTITAVTPAHGAGPVEVVVNNPDGRSAQLSAAFTYGALPPVVQAVTPPAGPIAGGTSVTISGSFFVAGATVTFDGVSATNVSVVSDTVINAQTPAHARGPVEVRVTNPDGQTGALSGGFTFVPPPSLESLSPSSGPVSGGTSVTLTGADFQSGAAVLFAGNTATVVSVEPTKIVVTSPQNQAGDAEVVVRNPDNQQSQPKVFNYVPPPAILTLSPNIGSTPGGTAVTVTGTGFADGATLTFDGKPATEVTVVDASTITAVTPAHDAGRVDVVVQNPDGQSGTAALGYEYSDVCVTCKKKTSEYAFGCSAGADGLALSWLWVLAWPALRRRHFRRRG